MMPLNIANRRELFVDDFLIESMQDASLKLHRPQRGEISFTADAAWEDNCAFPDRVLEWEGKWRMYYRASILNSADEQGSCVMAMAVSDDGVYFTRPQLGIVEFQGSRQNNIQQIGGATNVPPPFVDTNPAYRADQRFKGIFGGNCKGYAMASPDGIGWKPMQQEPLDLPGHFDTINTAFWDDLHGCYRCYTRSWHDRDSGRVLYNWQFKNTIPIRAIQHATSTDFIHWTSPEQLQYEDGDSGTHLYTNAILPCPGAEHLYLGFPNRFISDRKPDPSHPHEGVNDALFMTSRDGVSWKRWLDAWVRPGLDQLNWTERSNYPIWGIAQTSPIEWSMYISEHYRRKNAPSRIRRLAIRPWGFVSVHADHRNGQMLTKPITFSKPRLFLNMSTSAAGWIRVSVCDQSGKAFPGLDGSQSAPLFGDEIELMAHWDQNMDLSKFQNKPIRLRFELNDADLFAMRFVQ